MNALALRKLRSDGRTSVSYAALRAGLTYHEALVRLFPPERSPGRVLTRKINLRMDEDMHERLLAEAERQGIHHAELVRTFIEWGLGECA
jgi:hypothetical protein